MEGRPSWIIPELLYYFPVRDGDIKKKTVFARRVFDLLGTFLIHLWAG
jgi:hypothetical protein